MLSNRPYLLRAFHQWIVDSDCTPILVLDAKNPRCKVPREFAEGGEIVFNISTSAVRDLRILNEAVEFKASFSGVIHLITAPIVAVLAVYAEENGEGLFLEPEEEGGTTTVNPGKQDMVSQQDTMTPPSQVPPTKGKPFLTLVD